MKLVLNANKKLIDPVVTIDYNTINRELEDVIHFIEEGCQTTLELKCETTGKTLFVLPEVIYYIESVDKRTYAYLADKVYRMAHSLQDMERQLKRYGFCRISKSHVVNLKHIESIEPSLHMRVIAKMNSGEKLVINRSYKKSFETFMKERLAL